MATRFGLMVALWVLGVPAAASAQPLGVFRWQLQPFCNVLTVAITQNSGIFRLDGSDDQCGAASAASAVGTAFLNPDGTVGLGVNIVSAPGGAPVHVEATITLPSLSGTWRDSAGNAGSLAFTPGAGNGGPARSTAGTIGALAIDPTQVQVRVNGSCTAGLFMYSIGQNGGVSCSAPSGGAGVTSVSAGAGLTGGGAIGDITLALKITTPGSFDFSNVNGFVSTGTFTEGGLAAAGPGTRMLWYPGRAAFRAGLVGGAQWDDSNIGDFSFASGRDVTARGNYSVALGSGTVASGGVSTALGGGTAASGDYSLATGVGTVASGTTSTAMGSTTRAEGLVSTVMGTYARATAAAAGSFVYGDRSTLTASNREIASTAPNQFVVRATGGVGFYTQVNPSTGQLTAGVELAADGGNSWASVSDANAKENFRDVSGEDVLAKLAAMPIQEWNYKAQDASIRHIGPTAQDFRAAFAVGDFPLRINTVDADGIALVAIKALEARTRSLDERNGRLERENQELRERLARLEGSGR